jgi:hypothetical protein
MDRAVSARVWQRAKGTCEYCRLAQSSSSIPFEIDHIIAKKHGGITEDDNLALSCFYCNSYKGPNIAGIDPTSARTVRLFHPRRDRWRRHFAWAGPVIVGRTAVGRATIAVLELNHPDAVAVRVALLEESAGGGR